MIDWDPDRPRYRQIADDIRARIASGEYQLDQRLPGQPYLTQTYGVTRETMTRAMMVLRAEGLVVFEQRPGCPATYYVRKPKPAPEVHIGPGDRITGRMPTPVERGRMGLPPGVPVLVVTRTDDSTELYAGDTYLIG